MTLPATTIERCPVIHVSGTATCEECGGTWQLEAEVPARFHGEDRPDHQAAVRRMGEAAHRALAGVRRMEAVTEYEYTAAGVCCECLGAF